MKEPRTAGAALAARVRERMYVKGDSVTALAKRLRVSQSYLSELLAGDRSLQDVGDEVIREMAAYLQLPPVVCFLLAEKLRHADFVAPPTSLQTALNQAMEGVASSRQGLEAAVTPETLKVLPEKVKVLLVLLYESATAGQLLQVKRWQWVSTSASSEND